ncbi:MAG: hypothetical protein ACFCUJ_10110 [Thiotrichales bacterium]
MTQKYVGFDQDSAGGMTHMGRIVLDARVFGLIPESENCAQWSPAQMQVLYESVFAEWEKYGQLPSRLPDDLRERHAAIYNAAMTRARDKGWNPELGEDD